MKYLALLFTLISTAASAKTINLAWDPSPDTDIASYKLYYWEPNMAARTKDVGNVTTGTLDIEVAKAYSFAVTAINTAGLESDFSNIVLYFEMYGTPLELISVGPNKIALLSWLQAPPAKGYQLVSGVGNGPNIQWTSTNAISGYTNNFANVTLIQGTNFFRVRPVFQGQGGLPDYTSEYSATKEISPPKRPSLRLVLPPEQIVQ